MSNEFNGEEFRNRIKQWEADAKRQRLWWLIFYLSFLPAFIVLGLQLYRVLPEPAGTYIFFGVFIFQWLVPFIAGKVLLPVIDERQPQHESAACEKAVSWRRFKFGTLIKDPVTLKVSVVTLAAVAVWAVMLAAMSCIIYGFNGRAIDAVLAEWWTFAFILGIGVFRLIFHYAGIDPERGFDKLFYAAGIGTVGFTAGIVWAAFTHGEWNSQYQRDARRDFHKAIMGAPMPCLIAQDKLSDLSACTVFGLRPGMTQSEALDIVNNSGYFQSKDKPAVCKTDEKCSHSVFFLKDGLYLSVEFESDPKSAALDERVSKIVLSLDEGANPYFDENQMMEAFLKLIGPNGISINDTNIVWTDIKNALELRAYTSAFAFWAVFSSRLADHPGQPGVPV